MKGILWNISGRDGDCIESPCSFLLEKFESGSCMKLHQYRFNVFSPLMAWIDDKVDLSFGCLSRPDRKITEL